MASLALAASLVFLCVLIIGPISYSISRFDWFPKSLSWILGLCCILIGLWWFMLPISVARFMGLLTVWFGYLTIRGKTKLNA